MHESCRAPEIVPIDGSESYHEAPGPMSAPEPIAKPLLTGDTDVFRNEFTDNTEPRAR